MDLDATGWPELPTVGSKVEFFGGGILLQALGECTVVRADHVCNATGKPGGRVTLQRTNGELIEVRLSQVREHAKLIVDGLWLRELQAKAEWAAEHG